MKKRGVAEGGNAPLLRVREIDACGSSISLVQYGLSIGGIEESEMQVNNLIWISNPPQGHGKSAPAEGMTFGLLIQTGHTVT